MSIRLITLDLDNTTLYDSYTISRANREALEDAMAEGCEVAVASGRVFSSLPECVIGIPGIRYAITSNGAAIYKLPQGADVFEQRIAKSKCIRRMCIPADRVDAVMNLLDAYPSDQYPISFETFIDGQAYGYSDYVRDPVRYGASPAYIEYVRKTRIMVDDIRSFIREHRDALDGLDLQVGQLTMENGKTLVNHLRGRIRSEVPGLYMTSSVPNRIELSNEEAGKASGLRYLMNILGIRRQETAAFGDADNDIDMLQAAGTGIAVRNATLKCRKAADYVTKTCREDGVAFAIHRKLGFTDRRAVKEKYMRMALREAEKAKALDEVPIGCVIVREGRDGEKDQVIARGYNRRNTDRNTLSHAEMNAISKACRKTGDWRLSGCTMYVTLEPCPMCAGAIVQSRIDKIVIGCPSLRTGCAGSVMNLMRVPAFGHNVETETGVLEEECSNMLSGYFEGLRSRKKTEEKKNDE